MSTKHREIAEAGIGLLCERFPHTFARSEGRRRPLKIGINGDLVAAMVGAMTPQEIGAALKVYTSNNVYLRGLLKGAWRIDLLGNQAGTVKAEEKTAAKARLAQMERPKLKMESPAPPPAPPPAKRLSLSDLREAARQRRDSTKAA
jgi:sRNA-binding protein